MFLTKKALRRMIITVALWLAFCAAGLITGIAFNDSSLLICGAALALLAPVYYRAAYFTKGCVPLLKEGERLIYEQIRPFGIINSFGKAQKVVFIVFAILTQPGLSPLQHHIFLQAPQFY